MICPKCNTKNNDRFTFCYNCGEQLKKNLENTSATIDESAIGEHLTKMMDSGTYDINLVKRILKNKSDEELNENKPEKAQDYEKLMELTRTGSNSDDIDNTSKNEEEKGSVEDIKPGDGVVEADVLNRVKKQIEQSVSASEKENLNKDNNSQKSVKNNKKKSPKETKPKSSIDYYMQNEMSQDEFEDTLIDTIAGVKIAAENKAEANRKKRSSILINRIIALVILIIVASGLIWLLYTAISGAIKPSETPNTDNKIDMKKDVQISTDTNVMGDKYFNIGITTGADSITLMGKEYKPENNGVLITLTEYDIYTNSSVRPDDYVSGNAFTAKIPIVAHKEGYKDFMNYIEINVDVPSVPVRLISPDTLTPTINSTEITISFETTADAVVYINDEDYSSSLSEDGIFIITLSLPKESLEYTFNFKIEAIGLKNREIVYNINRDPLIGPSPSPSPEPGDISVTVDNKLPIESDGNGNIVITGKYSGNMENVQITALNNSEFEVVNKQFNEDGTFTINATTTTKGFIAIQFKQQEQLFCETVALNMPDYENFTRTALGLTDTIYNTMVNNSNYYAGRHFVVSGTVVSIEETDLGFGVTLNVDNNMIYVDVVKDKFSYEAGDKVRFFATRCDKHGDMPRFITSYVYRG